MGWARPARLRSSGGDAPPRRIVVKPISGRGAGHPPDVTERELSLSDLSDRQSRPSGAHTM
jgi:hypothetical protein